MPGLSVFPFSDCELWCCIILILLCADSEVLCLMHSFQGWERTLGITVPTSLTQSLRQELPRYHLQLSLTLSQKAALKSEFPTVIFLFACPCTMLGLLLFPPKKKRSACFMYSFEKQNALLHTLLFACAINIEPDKKKIKILLNTTNYSENKSHSLTMKVSQTEWDPFRHVCGRSDT